MQCPETILIAAFAVANSCRLLAYVPQILLLLKARDVASASSATWLLFAFSNGITAVYAAQIVADTAMVLTFTANTMCCATIVGLVQYKRRKCHRAMMRHEAAHEFSRATPGPSI